MSDRAQVEVMPVWPMLLALLAGLGIIFAWNGDYVGAAASFILLAFLIGLAEYARRKGNLTEDAEGRTAGGRPE